jgi:hypothetical protein
MLDGLRMPATRPRVLFAATLLAASTALLAATAVQADAAPTPTTSPSPSASPSASPSPEAPGAPGDLRVTASTPTSVTLSWTASTGGCCALDGYTVTYSQAFNDVLWSQPVGDVTSVTIVSSIRPAGQYTFSVLARDVAGHSSPSAGSVTVVTPAGTTGDVTPPTAPTGLQVTAVTTSGVGLTWSPSTDDVGVTAYDVYLFDGWYTSTPAGTAYGTTFAAPFTGSTSTGLRYYYVRARDAAGNLSIASGTVSVTAPTTTPPATPPPTTTPGCSVAYRTTSQRTGAFAAEVTITNTAATAVDGWALTFPFGGDQRITAARHATFTQNGVSVTLTGARGFRTVAPGADVTVALTGRWTATDAPPASATLNGSACTLT